MNPIFHGDMQFLPRPYANALDTVLASPTQYVTTQAKQPTTFNRAVHKQLRTELQFEILGLRLQVESTCARTLAEVHNHLRAHARPLHERSPDYLIRLREPLEKDRLRYLYRCQAADRIQDLGIDIRQRGSDWEPWLRTDPVLIPYGFPELTNRFCALHAASVVNPKGGGATLLLGERGTGKTTLSLRLAKKFGWPLLSDETTVIDNWSNMVWPLLRTPLVCAGQDQSDHFKKPMSEEEMKSGIVRGGISHVEQIVELVSIPGLTKPKVTRVHDPMIALSCVFRHDRAFGSKAAIVSRTFADLVRTTRTVQIMHGGYEQLTEISHMVERLGNETAISN